VLYDGLKCHFLCGCSDSHLPKYIKGVVEDFAVVVIHFRDPFRNLYNRCAEELFDQRSKTALYCISFSNIWIFWHEVAGNLWCIKFLNCEGYAQPSKCAVDRLSIALENERLTIEQISVVSYYCDHLKFRISEEKRQTRVHCSEVFNQNWLFLAQPA